MKNKLDIAGNNIGVVPFEYISVAECYLFDNVEIDIQRKRVLIPLNTWNNQYLFYSLHIRRPEPIHVSKEEKKRIREELGLIID